MPAGKTVPDSIAATADGDAPSPEPEPSRWLAIDLVIDEASWADLVEAGALVAAAAAALDQHAEFDAETSAVACISLATDAVVHDLNRTHRGKDKPTNVLSFPAPDGAVADETGRAFLGDIIIAAETLRAEAREQQIPIAHHLQHLTIHGLLHLLGFDHETDEDAADMESLETELLAGLGIADPYAATS